MSTAADSLWVKWSTGTAAGVQVLVCWRCKVQYPFGIVHQCGTAVGTAASLPSRTGAATSTTAVR